jgi:NADH dehydrogenase
MSKKRIVILGGGFGGAYAAIELERLIAKRSDVEVLLVSDTNFLLFTPMLHEVAAGDLNPTDIVTPLHAVLKTTEIFCGRIDSVDQVGKTVTLSHGASSHTHIVPFDHLIFALGSVTTFYGSAEIEQRALRIKTLGDAITLRNRMIDLFEEANFECCASIRERLLSFVIAGGGFAGVETAAAMQDFARRILPHYKNLSATDLHFTLVAAGDSILPELSKTLGVYAAQLLTARGMNLALNTKVAGYNGEAVALSSGNATPCATLVWAAGTTPNALIARIEGEKVNGRLKVLPTLRLEGNTSIWAIGDCAAVSDHDSGGFFPPTAQHATRQAKVVARNVLAIIDGKTPSPFRFKMLGQLASLGHRRGVAQILGVTFSGLIAWFLWRTVYLAKLPQFRRKLRVAIGWTFELFSRPDVAQLPVHR